jgi:uncharacterized Tic20 family protein
MSSNPSRPTPEWPASGPASSEPLDALPAAGDGFAAPSERYHTSPQDRVPGGAAARWPTTRSPWPKPGLAQAAGAPEPETGQRPAAEAPATAEPAAAPDSADPGDERLATLSYLGVPFLGPLVPLAIYVFRGRSAYTRRHAAQALNLSITTLLFAICVLILGTMLALDSIVVALVVAVPLAVALWLVTLAYVIVAGSSANRGDYYSIPPWICASIAH